MKILLISVGTRGDMDPFINLALLLKEKGHEVLCCFPDQFTSLAHDVGLNAFGLGAKFIDLLNSEAGKAAMGAEGPFYKKSIGIVKLAINQNEANKELVFKQAEKIRDYSPDRIIYNGKSVYPIIWSIDNPGKAILLSPIPYMHKTKEHAHIGLNKDFGSFFNKLSYSLTDFGLVTTTRISAKWLKLKPKPTKKKIREVLHTNKCLYTISPSLFRKPDDWGKHLHITGYLKNDLSNSNPLSDELNDFLNAHDKILFASFGSMINTDPEKKTKTLLSVLQKLNIPAVINIASGGFAKPLEYDESQFYFSNEVDYTKLFPRVYAVMHHGGSGTTHLGLKYACPTLIIPHIIDQFVWNKFTNKLGVGPLGFSIAKFNEQRLEEKLKDLWINENYALEAQKISNKILKEDFEERILDIITI